jgi:hypothetical protein
LSFDRRVHDGTNNDFIETMVLRFDMDQETGIGPDTRIATIDQRWTSVERTPQKERARLWMKL